MLLDTIKTPEDIRQLTIPELQTLADEIRQVIIETVSKTGGHLSSNLGVVELTLALHHVFDTPDGTNCVGCGSPVLSSQNPHRA